MRVFSSQARAPKPCRAAGRRGRRRAGAAQFYAGGLRLAQVALLPSNAGGLSAHHVLACRLLLGHRHRAESGHPCQRHRRCGEVCYWPLQSTVGVPAIMPTTAPIIVPGSLVSSRPAWLLWLRQGWSLWRRFGTRLLDFNNHYWFEVFDVSNIDPLARGHFYIVSMNPTAGTTHF